MSINCKLKNKETEEIIELTEHTIDEIEEREDRIDSSNILLSKTVNGVEIKGKINFADDSDEVMNVMKISKWSKITPHEKGSEISLEIEMISNNGEVYNSFVYESAFLQYYEEEFDLSNGVGSFCVFVRNKDELDRTLGARVIKSPEVEVVNGGNSIGAVNVVPVVVGGNKEVEGVNYLQYDMDGITNTPPKIENDKNNLVTLEQLDKFGFYMGKNSNEKNEGLVKLNAMLRKYDITNDLRISCFMGQVYHESSRGLRTLEGFNGNDPEEYFNDKYYFEKPIGIELGNEEAKDGQLFRGSGYIHLTGRSNFNKFSKAMEDERIMELGYRIVGGTYNKPVSKISYLEPGVIDVGKYAWESAGWFWQTNSLNSKADGKNVRGISATINSKDSEINFSKRFEYTEKFYKIRTSKNF